MTTLALERRFALALGVGTLALVLVLPVTLHVWLTFGPTSATVFAESQDILVNFRIPHHSRVDLWLDPIAGLAIAAVTIKEGRAAWRGENCSCAAVPGLSDEDACGCGPDCTDACCVGETDSRT